MASNLYWFYDALVVGILLISLYVGAKRGLMRSVVLILLTVLSIVISWVGAEIASPIIYDKLIKERIVGGLAESSESFDPVKAASEAISQGDYGVEISDADIEGIMASGEDFFSVLTDELKKNGASENSSEIQDEVEGAVAEKMLVSLFGDFVSPSTIAEILESFRGTTDGINQVLSVFISGDKEETAAATEEMIIAPVIKSVLKVIIFILLLLIFKLIIGPLSELFKGINKVPVLGPVNVLLGGALGVAEGAILVYVIALAVRMVVYFTEGSLMFLNLDTVEKTQIFKLFYNMDLTRFG